MRVKFENIKEAEAGLHPFYEVVLATSAKDITLKRTERLMAHIGNPEKRLRVVHIAGTSGKTSTTYYIAALLGASGREGRAYCITSHYEYHRARPGEWCATE